MTGYNLPPGCNVSDIPGNRPEDIAEEAFWEKLEEKCPNVPDELWNNLAVKKLIETARDMGLQEGFYQGRDEALIEEGFREMEKAEKERPENV